MNKELPGFCSPFAQNNVVWKMQSLFSLFIDRMNDVTGNKLT